MNKQAMKLKGVPAVFQGFIGGSMCCYSFCHAGVSELSLKYFLFEQLRFDFRDRDFLYPLNAKEVRAGPFLFEPFVFPYLQRTQPF